MALTSTVGGVTSGYCAMGSDIAATAPASVITIDSTEAKSRTVDEEMRNHGFALLLHQWRIAGCRPSRAEPLTRVAKIAPPGDSGKPELPGPLAPLPGRQDDGRSAENRPSDVSIGSQLCSVFQQFGH